MCGIAGFCDFPEGIRTALVRAAYGRATTYGILHSVELLDGKIPSDFIKNIMLINKSMGDSNTLSPILVKIIKLAKKDLHFFSRHGILLKHGSLVKRLRRRPLTAKTRVRFPYELLRNGLSLIL